MLNFKVWNDNFQCTYTFIVWLCTFPNCTSLLAIVMVCNINCRLLMLEISLPMFQCTCTCMFSLLMYLILSIYNLSSLLLYFIHVPVIFIFITQWYMYDLVVLICSGFTLYGLSRANLMSSELNIASALLFGTISAAVDPVAVSY